MLTWLPGTLEGADAGYFAISSSGELTFKTAPDYENAADADMDNEYMVTVKAADGTYMARRDVTVRVTEVEEATVGDTLLDRYDEDKSGMIEKDEVIQAIDDYLDSVVGLTKQDVIDVINLYLDS